MNCPHGYTNPDYCEQCRAAFDADSYCRRRGELEKEVERLKRRNDELLTAALRAFSTLLFEWRDEGMRKMATDALKKAIESKGGPK